MSDKSEKLAVGLTEEEKQQFRVEAAKRGVSMSELAREVLLQEVLAEGNPSRMTPTTAD